MGTRDGTHQPGFDKSAPFVDQHSLATDVILWQKEIKDTDQLVTT